MKNLLIRILEVAPFSIVFLYSIRFSIDPDLGWHLKQGEYFVNNFKIMDVNEYSREMPGFEYINYSWLFDVIAYLIFNLYSFWGISIVGALVVVLIFYFFSKAAKLDFFQKSIIFPLVIFLGNDMINNSLRGQLVSLLFSGITIWLLTIFDKYPKRVLVFMPIIMLLWSNLHAQFIIGLGVIGVWLFLKIIIDVYINKRLNFSKFKLHFLLLFVAFLSTLLNPYTYKIYLFVFDHFYNPQTLSIIFEWVSPFESKIGLDALIISFILYIFSLIFLIYKKKITKNNIFLILIPIPFLIQSTQHMRYIALSAFFLIPIIGIVLDDLRPKNIQYQKIIVSIILIFSFLALIYFFPFKSFIKPDWETYCSRIICSDEAAKYIIENDFTENLYTDYVHGGWLIWNYYPEIKPTLDGRMTVWRDDEGYSAVVEYFNYITGAKNINDTTFTTVLTNNIIGNRVPIYGFMEKLVEEGKWEVAYEDFYMIVFNKL